MDASDLDYRARTLTGCVPPHLVSRLVELGHTEEVAFQAGRGEWFCARERARLLTGQDRQAEALEVLAPYVATGWWKAAETTAELLEGWGRSEEAIALVRPYAEAGDRLALESFARMLARHGRGDEATQVLRSLADSPGGAEDWIVDMLCTHYADQGRAEEGLAYLDALKARRDGEDWEFFRMRLPLMVACGLREEATEQARAHPEGGTWYAAGSIAELLADAGRTEEAVAVLEQQGSGNSSILAWLLIDLGRVKDAMAVLQRRKPRPAKQLWTDGPTEAPPF